VTESYTRGGAAYDIRFYQHREDVLANVLLSKLGGDIELKTDERMQNTGNVFIEYRQKGRKSGIATTKAHWWAIEYNANCWIIVPTEVLKAIARKAWEDPKRRKQGGDNNDYAGVIVPASWLMLPPDMITGQVRLPVMGLVDKRPESIR